MNSQYCPNLFNDFSTSFLSCTSVTASDSHTLKPTVSFCISITSKPQNLYYFFSCPFSLWTSFRGRTSINKRERERGGEQEKIQFSSAAQSCLTLCDPMGYSMPGFPVHHQLLELAQTHVHQVGDATQPSHPLSSPSPAAFNPSQHQGLFKWVSSLHQVVKVLECQLQHQSFQWIFGTDFL